MRTIVIKEKQDTVSIDDVTASSPIFVYSNSGKFIGIAKERSKDSYGVYGVPPFYDQLIAIVGTHNTLRHLIESAIEHGYIVKTD